MNRRTEQGRTEFVVKGCLTRLALAFQFSGREMFTRDEVVEIILNAWHGYEMGKQQPTNLLNTNYHDDKKAGL